MEQRCAVRGQRFGALPGTGERADGAEFADEYAADDPVVADDDLAVGAASGIGELDDVVARAGSGSPNAARSRNSGPASVSRVTARVPV